MSLEPGRVAGNYEILDYIRSSNDEVCYRVRNTLARRVESMRVLGAAVASDPERTERFLREMGVQARLAHPNILTFFGAVELDRQLVIMSELVEGVTLAERLLCGPMTWDEACGFTLQLLAALGHAHSLGIVHRDVTPARMIVTPDGVLKLTDFGLAKANTSPALTQVGSVVGNLKYISPEQIRGTALVDGRSDLYSAGIVLYECVTGRVPFDQKSQFELMAAHVSQPPAAPSAVNPRIPAGADAVILKALQKDPAARYQSAADFAAALANASAVARTSVPLPASILSAELPRSATECGAVLTAPLAYMEAAAGANGPVPVVTIASAVPAPADVSQTPAPATEPMAAPAIPAEVAAPPENAIATATTTAEPMPVITAEPAISPAGAIPAASATKEPIPADAAEPAPAPTAVTPLKPEPPGPAAAHAVASAEKAPEPITSPAIPPGSGPSPTESPVSLPAAPDPAPIETAGPATGLRQPEAAEPAAAPTAVTPMKPESPAPAAPHPAAFAEKAPEPIASPAIPSGPGSSPTESPVSLPAGSGPAPIGTAGPASRPHQPEDGIIFSAPPARAWGSRETVIYGSATAALVLVILAAWLFTGNS